MPRIITPQFHREPGSPAPSCPPDTEGFEALRSMDAQALLEMGLRPWNDPDNSEDSDAEHFGPRGVLWLFPGEWYQHIPAEFPIVDISGRREMFKPGITDDDIRFGCLAYGIVAEKA